MKRDADIANGEAEKVQAVKQECEDDLAVAMPILESALKVRVTHAPGPTDPITHDATTLGPWRDGGARVQGMNSPPLHCCLFLTLLL